MSIDPAPDTRTLDELKAGLIMDFRGWKIARLRTKVGACLYAWRGRQAEGGCVRARFGRTILKKIYYEDRKAGRMK